MCARSAISHWLVWWCIRVASRDIGAATNRENVYIDGYDGKWWVHRREPRERFGPFDTHPEAVLMYGTLTTSVGPPEVFYCYEHGVSYTERCPQCADIPLIRHLGSACDAIVGVLYLLDNGEYGERRAITEIRGVMDRLYADCPEARHA